MTKLPFLVLLLLAPAVASAQSKRTGTFRFTQRQGRHTARIVVRAAAFDPSRHRVRIVTRGEARFTEVDGREALGTDATVPRFEIRAFDFYFDGKKVAVPRRLYSDLFDPGLDDDSSGIRIGDDGASLLVFMAGGDGAGSYQVIWALRADGRHSRFSHAYSGWDWTSFKRFLAQPSR